MLRRKNYIKQEKIGKGRFSVVYRVVDVKTQSKEFAMKVVKRKHRKETDEVELLKLLQSHNFSSNFFVHLHDSYESKKKLYIILEYVRGRFQSLLQHQFNEITAKFYAMQVMVALDFIHQFGIVHGDIKPENILIAPNGYLKISDFGNAKRMTETRKIPCSGFRGTVDYVAPEIITEALYDEAVDLWALGVLIYEMLSGHAPFTGMDDEHTKINIIYCMLRFPSHLSEKSSSKNVIRRLLIVDPKTRLESIRYGDDRIYSDPWFLKENDYSWSSIKEQTAHVPDQIQAIITERYESLY